MNNILLDPWLPFRLSDGSIQTLPFSHICNPNIIDFALPRADFQGAAYQFGIGVLQTVYAPQDKGEWRILYEKPPERHELESAFKKIAHAFNTSGDGPLFMQDFDNLEDMKPKLKPKPIKHLLIEAPGESTINYKNTDFFIKRECCDGMSPEMANMALYTLQINAPEGGQGHLTSLRGGGPITTLIRPQSEDVSLWQKLWLNVINREYWKGECHEPNFKDGSVFPWLEPTRKNDVYRKDVHPLHMYWAMPRRIRLQIDDNASECGISGRRTSKTVRTYLTKPKGNNYKGDGWKHPLTPYQKTKKGRLSVKGQSGGINYNQWVLMTLNNEKEGRICAFVVDHYREKVASKIGWSKKPRLWMFGYNMKSNNALGWYSVTMPLFDVNPKEYGKIVKRITDLQSLAERALKETSKQIKSAWFERPKDAKGDFSFINAAFWPRTEQAFYIAVERITRQSDNSTYMSTEQAKEWLNSLRNVCMNLFDEYALSDEIGESMCRQIIARLNLKKWLFVNKEVKKFHEDYNIPTKQDKAR